MNSLRVSWLVLALAGATKAGTVADWDDIAFWVGDGANRAALAIDWDGAKTTDEALVWGYRWDGEADGERMLRDIVAADPWLYARVGSIQQFGFGVWGLGYDVDQDGLFGIDDPTALFDAGGIATTSPSDGSAPTDPGDLYQEGWTRAYWHYGLGQLLDDGIAWTTSGLGASSVLLTDGDWNSYAIARTLNYDEFATNLVAAEPPRSALDVNADGAIDAADYTLLRDAGGVSAQLTAWADAYGSTGSIAVAVPEPNGLLLLLITTSLLCNPSERG